MTAPNPSQWHPAPFKCPNCKSVPLWKVDPDTNCATAVHCKGCGAKIDMTKAAFERRNKLTKNSKIPRLCPCGFRAETYCVPCAQWHCVVCRLHCPHHPNPTCICNAPAPNFCKQCSLWYCDICTHLCPNP